jgi:hypothetical protein
LYQEVGGSKPDRDATICEKMLETDESYIDKQKIQRKHHMAGTEDKINFEEEVELEDQTYRRM